MFCFVLGDQFNYKYFWYEDKDVDIFYFLVEMKNEMGYVCYYI